MNQIIRIIVITAILTCLVYGTYDITKKSLQVAPQEPQSDFIWIDSNRFHKDSIIFCSPIYGDESKVIGSYIRITHGVDQVYIECLDREGYTWQDWKQSWLDAFKEGCK
jgi:hypothetical protein